MRLGLSEVFFQLMPVCFVPSIHCSFDHRYPVEREKESNNTDFKVLVLLTVLIQSLGLKLHLGTS